MRGVRVEPVEWMFVQVVLTALMLRDIRFAARPGKVAKHAATRPQATTIRTVFRPNAARGLAPEGLGPCTPRYIDTPDKSG